MTMKALIVEDEPLVALELEQVLRSACFGISGCVGSIERALAVLDKCGCDFAVLDANLRGKSVEPVAAALKDRGKPVLFVSGYGRSCLPASFFDAPLVSKPFKAAELIRAVKEILQTDLPSN